MKRCGAAVILLFLFFSSPVHARHLDGEALNFLRENRTSIEEREDWEFLEPGLSGREIFLAGESHGVGINATLAYELLLFFYREAGVRYYLWEGGYALGEILNRYLQGGEEELLELFMSQIEDSSWHTEEQHLLWQKVRDFNSQRPQEDRLEVVGIDLDLPLTSVIIYLDYLLPDDIPPELEPLRLLASEYQEIDNFRDRFSPSVQREVFALAEKLEGIISRDKKELKELLGADWKHFKYARESLFRTEKAWPEGQSAREKNSFFNLTELEPRLDRGNFFGQWGAYHVLKRELAGVEWLGSLLNGPGSPWKGKVMSIYFVYDHCMRLKPHRAGVMDYSSKEISDLPTLRRAGDGQITLFGLQAEASPFREQPYLLRQHTRGGTTDYFDYLLLIRNQEASTPYAGAD